MAGSVEDLLDGIGFYVDKRMKDAPQDKTDTAIVNGTTEFGYSILYNGKLYNDIKTIGGSCFTNETVRIVIPQNNMSNMFILKSPTTDDISNLQNQINAINARFDKYYSLLRDNGSIPYISNNANLNDYRTPGNYYCAANAIAKTLINAPTGISGGNGTAFSLKVEYILGDASYISQTLTTYNTGYVYYRMIYTVTNTWDVWRVTQSSVAT